MADETKGRGTDRPKDEPKGSGSKPTVASGEAEPGAFDAEKVFLRERNYPDIGKLFAFRPPPLEEVMKTALVALDANALLLPYLIESKSLADIKKTYAKLLAEKRLRVP